MTFWIFRNSEEKTCEDCGMTKKEAGCKIIEYQGCWKCKECWLKENE